VTSISEYNKEKRESGKPYQPDSHTGGGKGSHDPNAMEIELQSRTREREKDTFTYLQSMKVMFRMRIQDILRKKAIMTEML